MAWTDSMVALSWIKSSGHRWKTFISNRVSYIEENIAPAHWRYISSSENPADCASRSLLIGALISHTLWWSGPKWMDTSASFEVPSYPTGTHVDQTALNEEEKKQTLVGFTSIDSLDNVLNKFSSPSKMKRIIAYVLRFLHNVTHPNSKNHNTFTDHDLYVALVTLVRRVQHISFKKEISCLENNKPLPKAFKRLNPFIEHVTPYYL